MEKVLILASVASMIDQFNMHNIKILQNMGYEVHVAANFEYGSTSSKERVAEFKNELRELGIPYYHIDFSRNIKNIKANIKAYREIVQLIITNGYVFIHCHSPIGGVCGRLAAKKTKTKVIYTAHGFHFFNGAPIINWLLYYPVERWLARYTDVLITINKEDYGRAQTFNAKKVEYIPGVGIDTEKYKHVGVSRDKKRLELGISTDTFVVLSVGELNKNKNHETIIRAIALLKERNIFYLICGKGPLEKDLLDLSKKLGIEQQVKLLGFRKDIAEICIAADIFAFPSKREGLGLAALEAMAAGLPLLTSNIHGIVDYSVDGITGFACNPKDIGNFTIGINKLLHNKELREKVSAQNKNAVKNFDVETVNCQMKDIYNVIK